MAAPTVLSPYTAHPYRQATYASSYSSVDTSEWFKVSPDASAPRTLAFTPFVQPEEFTLRHSRQPNPASTLKTLRGKVSRSFRKPKTQKEEIPIISVDPELPRPPPRAFVVMRPTTPDDSNIPHSGGDADQSVSSSEADTTLTSDMPVPDAAWKEQIFSLVAESLSAQSTDTSGTQRSSSYANMFGSANPLSIGAVPIHTLPQRRSFLSLKGPRPELPVIPAAAAKPAWNLPRRKLRRASSWDSPSMDRGAPSPPPGLQRMAYAPVDIVIDAQLDDFLDLMPPSPGEAPVKPTLPVKSVAVQNMRSPLRRLPLVNKPLPPTPQDSPALPCSVGLGLSERAPAPLIRPSADMPQPRTMKPETLATRAQHAISLDLANAEDIPIESLESMLDELHVLGEEMRLARARAVARALMSSPAPLRSTTGDSTRTKPIASEPRAKVAPLRVTRGKENAPAPTVSRIPVRKSSLWESLKQKGMETMSLSPMPPSPRSPSPCRIVITPPAEEGLKEFEWK
jgi:hypothetical protein